jgi:predicted aldo/keto reductase-like oxidoreductase
MEYRQIGKTDIMASVIGLGCEGIAKKTDSEVDAILGTAMDGGVNMLDLYLANRTTRQQVGTVIKGRRDKIHIQGHIGSTDIDEQDDYSRDLAVCKKYFDTYFTDLGTDYIDFGMFFFVDKPEDYHAVFEGELLEYGEKLKKEGKVRCLGASCHNSVTARRIVETGVVDLIMFSVNPAFDMTPPESDIYELLDDKKKLNEQFKLHIEPDRAALYKTCAERNVSITVMKTLCAGRLLRADLSPFGKAMTVGQCVNYALSRPAVTTVMLGAASKAQVEENLRYFELSDAEKDYSAVIQGYQGNYTGNCMYCNHCQPCPSNIDIAAVTKYADIAALSPKAVPETIIQHYKALKAHGSDCVQCRSCEERCPFGVKVTENMARAEKLFGL